MNGQPNKIGVLHFVGIGGIGMSGIAEIMNTLGYKVQGSDLADSANVKRLRKQDIRVMVGHDAKNILDDRGAPCACIVISSAVKADNAELVAARQAKIPVVRRAEMLAELMRLKRAVAISGTHGKTTTTMMAGQMLETAGFDPTVINGGIVNAYGTNTRLGKSDWMVVEADESDGTFTRLPATVAVVTNIDPEHLDHYGTFEKAKEAYRQFILNLPFYGYAVLCADHPEVQTLVAHVGDRKVITYGFNPQADVQADNVRSGPDGSLFDVKFAGWLGGGKEQVLRDVHLPMLGRHNVQNSLASLAIAQQMDVPAATMKKALASFSGVKRRFTKTGESHGVTVIDDYGHHPVEIEVVLKTARTAVQNTKGRIIAIAQPHRYTRLHDLFDGFCACFNEADTVIVADVYPAGEQPIAGADKTHLVEGIKKRGHRNVSALSSKEDLPRVVAEIVRPGDYVVCLGAGDITYWAYDLPAELDKIFDFRKSKAPSVRGTLTEKAPLGLESWFGCGGAADLLFSPADEDDLAAFLASSPSPLRGEGWGEGQIMRADHDALRTFSPPSPNPLPEGRGLTIIGGLANTIIRDGGIRGVTIRLGKPFADIKILDDVYIEAGAGALNGSVAAAAMKAGIGGLEFLSGIPGMIGGALRMNAGAYGTEMKDVLIGAQGVLSDGRFRKFTAEDLHMTYRHTDPPPGTIFTSAILKGRKEDYETVRARMNDIKTKRNETQPIREKTGGSTFANPSKDELKRAGLPEGTRAWKIVELVDGRGLKIGGAQMSEMHSNFMINTGDAAANDLEMLGEELRRRAAEKFGINLRWEINRVGEA